MFWLWTFLIYGLLFFVACYIVSEVGQNFFYDETTPYLGLKVLTSALALAAAMTWWSPSSLDMVTTGAAGTLLLVMGAFVLFVLVLRFHAPHAVALGPATVFLVAFASAMAVESLENSGRPIRRERLQAPEPIRKSTGGFSAPIQDETPLTEGEDAEGAAANP